MPIASGGAVRCRVCLLIRTHALPAFSYLVPAGLSGRLRVGSVVSAPLSGRQRVGVVVALERAESDAPRATEWIRSVSPDLALPETTVALCERLSQETSTSLAQTLRCALPPGLRTDRYAVRKPAPDWPWSRGEVVSRTSLRRTLGEETFREAEADGRVSLEVRLPEPPSREFAVALISAEQASRELRRAPSQRQVFERLLRLGGEAGVEELLASVNASRQNLRALAARGLVRLERRATAAAISSATGAGDAADERRSSAYARVLREGEVCVRRVPSRSTVRETLAVARAAFLSGTRLLVLVPETSLADRIAGELARHLPAEATIGRYHGRLGDERAGVWRAAMSGELDVLVGTRSAALLPLRDIGAVCVLDEPNPAHRAAPGHEGLAAHAREVALARSAVEGSAVVFLSPFPSLRLAELARRGAVRELRPLHQREWADVRLVDVRGTGAYLSEPLISACKATLARGGSVGVVSEKSGHSRALMCGGCGRATLCRNCGVPLIVTGPPSRDKGMLACGRCDHREPVPENCPECGSGRLVALGTGAGRLRELLLERLGVRVGTAPGEGTPVVVGSPAELLCRSFWDLLVFPAADSFLFGSWMGASERAFRVLYGAAESCRRLVVQTRDPENPTLLAAVRGDYRAFAAAELSRLRKLGYPPFGHLARLDFSGREQEVRRAVESLGVTERDGEVTSSGPVRSAAGGEPGGWTLLLRAKNREAVARAARRAAVRTAKSGGKVRLTVEIDPEEI